MCRTVSPSSVLDFAESGTLEEYIEKHKTEGIQINERMVWKVVCQVLIGLHQLKCRDVAHCDLKPSNILLGTDGSKIWLSDFNSCKKVGTRFKLDSMITPYYTR